MSRGTAFQPGELEFKLKILDIDEGIRVEAASDGKVDKLFINRRASGEYVIQHFDNFFYTFKRAEVRKIIMSTLPGSKITFWAY